MEKVKKTIFVAIFVSLAALIKFDFITEGFIIAMSVTVMAIFIYCYEDLTPLYIAFCSGIASPLVRLAMLEWTESGQTAAVLVIPDMAFFFAYGIIYTTVYSVINKPKSIRNFPYVIMLSDFLSNMVELFARSIVQNEAVITLRVTGVIFIVAFCRTALIQVILLAIEVYSNLLLKQEHDREYRKLLVQTSIFESELHVMEKNVAEIEEIMKQAYDLYKSMENIDAPKELKECSLNISKNAHEIKGDYLSIISALRDTFLDDVDEGRMGIRDIAAIECGNLQSMIKSQGLNIAVSARIKADFHVKQYFKMMSIMRNLLLNSAEAIGSRGGRISLSVREEGEFYFLEVRDNGPGISAKDLSTVFYEGYSTKFNTETGNVQRGLGLTLVKDYVENLFHGRISVSSEKDKFTEFSLSFPKSVFEEEQR